VEEPALGSLVTHLVLQDAFPERQDPQFAAVTDGSLIACAVALEQHGLLCHKDIKRMRKYRFTHKAINDNYIVSRWTLHSPQRAFQVRADIPLEDATCHELMAILDRQHWTWRAWLPATKVTDEPLPIGYKIGDAKEYFSSPTGLSLPYCVYLISLLKAED
jgi:hypothetical protein